MNRDSRGFTLTEITIALTLLSVALVGAVSTFITLSRLHRKTITVQTLQNESRFITESIARDVRNGSKVFNPAGTPDELVIVGGFAGDVEIRYYYDTTDKKVYREQCVASVCEAAVMNSEEVTAELAVMNVTSENSGLNRTGFVSLSFSFDHGGDLVQNDPNFDSYDVYTIVAIRGGA